MKVSSRETSTSPDNVLEGSLKYEECIKIPVKCMRNLEKEMKEIHSLAHSTNDSHIKDKKQVTDLSKAMKCVCLRSLLNWKKIGLKRKLIIDPKNKVSSLNKKFKKLD